MILLTAVVDVLDPEIRISFLCIGNPLIERDLFGVLFAEALNKLNLPRNWQVLNCETVPENFIGKVINFKPDVVFFVDSFEGTGEMMAPMSEVLDRSFGTHKTSLHQLNEFIQNFCSTESWFFGHGVNSSTINHYKAHINDTINQIFTILRR